jgi:prepilin-type N-terminal cleavage/methylation domain-containing protein
MTRILRRLRDRTRDDSGFTLPELMVAIVILGIIVVPITSAIIVGLLTTGDAQTRLAETQSALLTSAFWAGDVQSADGTVRTTGGPSCGSGSHVASFTWTEASGTSYAASYVVRTDSSGVRTLRRNFCRNGVQVTSGTVAPELGAANPQVTCTPSCAKPTSVSITMTTPQGFAFTLNGTRRSTS